ncbi:hypothetical protein [Schinkia azotoformans]|uniref:hypothetical protein n=1 Tax=Schinkia azotoformans TaxID=1454 RepID=UPI002DBE7BD2|nr:hypothetical protein [Schinkia azotoformans]MEC1780075.1 hypothetical protein [Schinkia azotoformans]MED4330846.1 hypothetical protein [Schinkia azotoformans]
MKALIACITHYLENDSELLALLNNENAFYLLEKPINEKHDHFIVFKIKELTGGHINDYQIDFLITSKDVNKVIDIKERIKKIFDKPRSNNELKHNNLTIRHSRLLNGGGMVKDEQTSEITSVVYFLFKL